MADDKKKKTAAVAELTAAFKKSTIQRSWSFIVDFLDQDYADLIPAYRVVSISVPFLGINSDSAFKAGAPLSFPTGAETEPFDITFGVIEDAYGSGRTLVQHLMARIRKPNGLYAAPNAAKFSGLSVKILDYAGNVTDTMQIRDMLYQNAESISFDHEGAEAVKIQITCKADILKRLLPGK